MSIKRQLLTEADSDMLAALQKIEPLLDTAYEAGRRSYTYEALMECMKARDIARQAIIKAGGPEEWIQRREQQEQEKLRKLRGKRA